MRSPVSSFPGFDARACPARQQGAHPDAPPDAGRRRLATAALLGWALPATGTAAPGSTRVVGPGERWRTLAEAVRAAGDGDTLLLQPGEYRGDVAVVTQQRLAIRGLGDGAVFHADGGAAEGKAILVVRGGAVAVQNCAFHGCRVPHGNGAGIRFEAGRLRLDRCRFFDNEMGLLSAAGSDMSLEVVDCEFGLAPHHPGLLHHLLYVGRIGLLDVRGSRFEQGWRGHLLKSRALASVVRGNWLVDGPLGEASYELEFPDGGDNVVAGNVIAQAARTGNPHIVSMGAEATPGQSGRLILLHNTLVNLGDAQASFVRLWSERLTAGSGSWMSNNLVAGSGQLALLPAQDGGGNARVELSDLRDAGGGDFRLHAGSRLSGTAVPLPPGLAPPLAFVAPVGSRAFPVRGALAPGALQPVG